MSVLTSCLSQLPDDVSEVIGRQLAGQWPTDALVYLMWDTDVPAPALHHFARHRSAQVRSEAARCADLRDDDLERLSRDRSVTVKRAALAHASVRRAARMVQDDKGDMDALAREACDGLGVLTQGMSFTSAYLPGLARLVLASGSEELLSALCRANGTSATSRALRDASESGHGRLDARGAALLSELADKTSGDCDLSWCTEHVESEEEIRQWAQDCRSGAILANLAAKAACPDDVLDEVVGRSSSVERSRIAADIYQHPNASAATALTCIPYLTAAELEHGQWWRTEELLEAALAQRSSTVLAEVLISGVDMSAAQADSALAIILGSGQSQSFVRNLMSSETMRRAAEHPAFDRDCLLRACTTSSGATASQFLSSHPRADASVRIRATYVPSASPEVLSHLEVEELGRASWQLARVVAEGRYGMRDGHVMEYLAIKVTECVRHNVAHAAIVEEFAPTFPGSIDEYFQALAEAAD